MNWPKRVTVVDVGPRDGLQDEEVVLATEDKLDLIRRLAAAGLSRIEVTSFAHPKLVPQMADAEAVCQAVADTSRGTDESTGMGRGADAGAGSAAGKTFEAIALVLNKRGAERALATPVRRWNVVVSASETHNRKNTHRSVDESLGELHDIAALAEAHGCSVEGVVSTSFGCPFEGHVPLAQLHRVVSSYVGMGTKRVTLADTTGMANPKQVYETMSEMRGAFPNTDFGLHLHDTRGLGLANVVAGLQAGIVRFDASVGGIGGCPFTPDVPGAGNIATEDLAHMLEEMGIETGIDLDGLIAASRWLAERLGHELPSRLPKTGKAYDLHEADEVRTADATAAAAPRQR